MDLPSAPVFLLAIANRIGRARSESSDPAQGGLSFPALRSLAVFALWQLQQRGSRFVVLVGPWATRGRTWSHSVLKWLPQSRQRIPSKSGGGPSSSAARTSTGMSRDQRLKFLRSLPS